MTTLSRRFAGAFILLVAMPSLVVSVILSRLYLTALHETVELQSQATAEQVAQNVRTETESAAILAAALFHDDELRRLADGYGHAIGATERFLWTRALDERLVSFFTYSNRIGEVVLYLGQGSVYRYANDPALRAADTLDRRELAGAAADPGKVFLLDTLDVAPGRDQHMISIAVCPVPGDPIAATAILLRLRVPTFDALAAGPGGPGGDGGPDVVMLGRSGHPILSSLPAGAIGPELEPELELEAGATRSRTGAGGAGSDRSSFRSMRVAGRSWLATVQPLDSTGWTLLLLADEAVLSRRVTRYAWYLYPAIALLAALFIAYAELFFARVAAPIRAIVGHMARVGQGDYAVRAAPPAIRELAELARGFNRMVEETERLQAERARIERDRLSAELEALRYQINPHFIANTLNSIKLMASAARADSIAGMTRDLMQMVSDSYAGAGVLTELARELASITAYTGIMKVRFGERFGLEIDAEPGTESLLVLRMILQPIVENSILHGFARAGSRTGRASRGTIRVTARREARPLPPAPCPEPWATALPGQVLILEVRDDGVGIPPGVDPRGRRSRAAGRPGPESLHRIGISNVERRIALNFGAPYDLEIESEPDSFTLVRYILPALARDDRADEGSDAGPVEAPKAGPDAGPGKGPDEAGDA
ncbi:MAG TPA: histidine kinase [Kofleriaceae bacterium]|jgi:two-component system sensor histidine kinase YesM|nr:histidine kinase [Kofleriaceae bacterium]